MATLAENTAVINRAKIEDHARIPIVLNYIPGVQQREVRLYSNFDRVNRQRTPTLLNGPTAELNDTFTAIDIISTRNGTFSNVTVVIGNFILNPDPNHDSHTVVAGALNISVSERFPQRLTATVDPLDRFFRTDETEIKLTDADGFEYIIQRVHILSDFDPEEEEPIRQNGNRIELNPLSTQTGTFPVEITVNPGEYKSLKSNGSNTHNVNVRVVRSTPSLRLSATSVTLLDDRENDRIRNLKDFTGGVAIRLLTANARIPFESFYEIESIESFTRSGLAGRNDITVRVDYTSMDGYGELIIRPEDRPQFRPDGLTTAQAGRTNLRIRFKNGTRPVELPLDIRVTNPTSLTPSPATRTVTLNERHEPGTEIITLPINLNASNLILPDWQVIRVVSGITEAQFNANFKFDVGDDPNTVTFSVRDTANLSSLFPNATAARVTIPVRIGSPELMRMNGRDLSNQRFVTVNLVITRERAASFTIARSGSISVSNPESAINVTIRLTNTLEKVKDVRLLERDPLRGLNDRNQRYEIAPTDPSEFFNVIHTSGENTFRIIPKPNVNFVLGFNQRFGIEVELESGHTLTSWRDNGTATHGMHDRVAYRFAFNIAPAQAASRAWQSSPGVTLRSALPFTGGDIRLNLTTPANVKVGFVNIQQDSMTNLRFIRAIQDPDDPYYPNYLGYTTDPATRRHTLYTDPFEIVQNGGDNWTIRFKNGEAPWGVTNAAGARANNQVNQTGATRNALPASGNYNIRLEIWPEGTYEVDTNGEIILDNGRPIQLRDSRGRLASRPTLVTVRVNILS